MTIQLLWHHGLSRETLERTSVFPNQIKTFISRTLIFFKPVLNNNMRDFFRLAIFVQRFFVLILSYFEGKYFFLKFSSLPWNYKKKYLANFEPKVIFLKNMTDYLNQNAEILIYQYVKNKRFFCMPRLIAVS